MKRIKGGGRQQGSKKWTEDKVQNLLDIVEEILPAGSSDEWNLLVLEAVDAFEGKEKNMV